MLTVYRNELQTGAMFSVALEIALNLQRLLVTEGRLHLPPILY